MTATADILAVATPQIKQDEGCRLHSYPDPLSGGDPWTIGYGATGPDIGPATIWTQEEADTDLGVRLSVLCDSLDGALPWWIGLAAPRAAVLVNMAYNLGLNGLLGFPHMLAAAQAGKWAEAHDEMLNSAWARQVPARALRLANQMQTGRAA